MLSRELAREAWTGTGLTIGDLTAADLSDLRARLDRGLRASGLIRGSFRMQGRVLTRSQEGRLRSAELRCRSDYFTDRQAVTFEEGGFVGFAGWADEVNVQPVLTAFIGWARERARRPLPA
ncbi:hypothetical protein IQ03_01364 [Gemmobacter caeni]|uniref:Uncharacterized protein n=1 Tax=Gemmobacter caeni TaxID=589035 RepID=A0A2T6B8K4_9RHOB|nr:hypothetical protein [Gemmobacter caeni]PTX52383.1 hypothetical protein C8N34_102162 [Gemmobacter caeni]TWJ02945.1 hypothetical protein IQ03_01364 [Gemmobacter caeni]